MNYADVQKRLNDLGAKPPLVPDGSWGPKSKTALSAFQKAQGLVVDGIPGPKTLKALGFTSDEQESMSYSTTKNVSSGNPNDVNAYAISKRAAPDMPEAERQYVLAVARGEGHYGLGWGNPSAKTIEASKKFGISGTEGVGSNNWGATQGKGDAGSFPHVDYHADGTPYLGQYRKWSTPEKGFLDIANIILGGGKRGPTGAAEIKAAIGKGDLKAAVYAQHANGYFELDPAAYLSAVARNYESLASATGWKRLLEVGAMAAAGGGVALVLLGLGIAGALWWLKRGAS